MVWDTIVRALTWHTLILHLLVVGVYSLARLPLHLVVLARLSTSTEPSHQARRPRVRGRTVGDAAAAQATSTVAVEVTRDVNPVL